MKVLFLSIIGFENLNNHGIYSDLLRTFEKNGHEVYIVSSRERKLKKPTEISKEKNVTYLKLKVGNLTQTGIFEKGIATLLIERQYKNAIKKYFSRVKFDLILYHTPPITFCDVIRFVKKRDQAKTYLLLKDIFPQNAVDLGMMKKTGIKGLIYKFFRRKEKNLYEISDRIGCMSQANVDYVLKHNPEITPDKVEICPNSIEVIDKSVSAEMRIEIRKKYGIPLDKVVFVYGGNLGKPQGIPFLIKCLESQKENKKAFFLIVGDGTEYGKLEEYERKSNQSNFKLMKRLPKEDYDTMIGACDVGMIFLDHRFTIPNFPSRLLSYMQAKLPVLACTDPNTDIGKVIVEGGFGWWCESDDVEKFLSCINEIFHSDLSQFSEKSSKCLFERYNIKTISKIIENLI